MKSALFILLLSSISFTTPAQQNATHSFEQWISLRQAGGVQVSPDGKQLIYTVTSTQWSGNSYDTEIWLSRDGGKPFQLTQSQNGSSNAANFSPDSKWISFIADRGNKRQLYLIAVEGGEAFAITNEEEGIGGYDWSPDGTKIAFTKNETDSKKRKKNQRTLWRIWH